MKSCACTTGEEPSPPNIEAMLEAVDAVIPRLKERGLRFTRGTAPSPSTAIYREMMCVLV